MNDKLKITLKKSLIGRDPRHVQMAHQLGLRKINRSVEMNDNPAIRGIINKINYLLVIEESAK